MEKKILDEIYCNNLEKAMLLIKDLEKTLLLEKSDYQRYKNLEIINKCKKEYSKKIEIKNIEIKKTSNKFELSRSIIDSKHLKELSNLLNVRERFTRIYSDSHIVNCEKCEFENIKLDNTLMIEDCVDCVFTVECNQIRWKRSRNIKLVVNVKSGISLKECKEIKIFKNKHTENNKYKM